jgi:hypothetical protein
VKEVRYVSTDTEKRLLKVSSRSTLDAAVYGKGCYFTNIDDGYKVRAVPFLPTHEVTLASPWTISTASFVFYAPGLDRVPTHYRYRVNGDYCYGEIEGVKSEYVPGGAVTALGQRFVDAGTPLTIESRYVLLEGDPRASSSPAAAKRAGSTCSCTARTAAGVCRSRSRRVTSGCMRSETTSPAGASSV